MTRKTFIPALFLFSHLLLACKPTGTVPISRESGKVVLRLAESMSAEHPSAKAVEYFASLVHRRSDGKIRIRIYYGGRLGTPEQVIAQVQFGGIAMARVNVLELAETVSLLQNFVAPKVYTSSQEVMESIRNDRETIADACLRERLMPLVFYYPDLRCIYSDVFKIRSIPDFQGVRIGVVESRVLKAALTKLRANPVNLISADTYKSLRNGYIQARETTFSEFVLSDDYPFVNHLTLSRYVAAPDLIIMSPEVLNDLSTSERRMISDCAEETYAFQKELMDKFHVQWISRLRSDKKDVFWEDDRFRTDLSMLFK